MAPMKRPAQHAAPPTSLSLQQLARRWSMKRRDVRHLLQAGKLQFEQVLGQLRVPLKAIRHFEKTTGHRSGSH